MSERSPEGEADPTGAGAHAPQAQLDAGAAGPVEPTVAQGKQFASIPGEVIRDLKEMDFADEVLPLDAANVRELRGDAVFWSVAFLGLAPLVIATLPTHKVQLAGFALFFATVWAAIMKHLIVRAPEAPLRPLIQAFLFSGTLGVFLLMGVYDRLVPVALLALPASPNPFASAVGFVLQVGVLEECVKVLPVLFFVRQARRRRLDVLSILLVGVFSGLGFASLENLLFSDRATEQSIALTAARGAAGLRQGVYSAMVVVMLRSLSLVFCHGLWSGIFAYFIAVSRFTQDRFGALFIVGLAVSSTLHGLYDWASFRSTLAAASMASVSFILFYAYMSKLDHTFGVDDSGSRRRAGDRARMRARLRAEAPDEPLG